MMNFNAMGIMNIVISIIFVVVVRLEIVLNVMPTKRCDVYVTGG